MLRRGLVAALLAAGLLAATAAPAQAIPPGESLIVFAYWSDSTQTQLVGQQWHGCGTPAGSWGILSGYRTVYFTPC